MILAWFSKCILCYKMQRQTTFTTSDQPESPPADMSASQNLRGSLKSMIGLVLLSFYPLSLISHAAATTQSASRTPVQAELLKPVEAGRVQVGAAVYARVQLAWKDPACKLREGAILKGRIVLQTPRTKGKSSELAMVFDTGQCGGREMKPLPMNVAAVLAPDKNRGPSLSSDQQGPPLSDAVGLNIGMGGGQNGRSMMEASLSAVYVESPRDREPKTVLPGQVIGLSDLKVNLGKGPEGSSILTSERHNLRLDYGSRLVLVPNVNAVSAAAEASSKASLTEPTDSAEPSLPPPAAGRVSP